MIKRLKISVGYPTIEQEKGVPLLSQNRQFQYFNSPTYIYPMVPAYAASLAQERGYEVVWLDGIAEGWTYKEWKKQLKKSGANLLMLETKSPVVKQHWKIIDDLKNEFEDLLIVIVGDQVTYKPMETLDNCDVDFVILGGDYDFVLSDLADALSKDKMIPHGVWGKYKYFKELQFPKTFELVKSETDGRRTYWNTGNARVNHELDTLPFVDRDLTRWQLYAYENGNYKYTPATYMYSGRDCWWNRCTFCVWDHTLNPKGSYRRFSPERLFAEVKHVVDNYGVREIFDDAGTLFVGPPLKKFCELLIESGYNKKVVYGCNMRLNALSQEYYDLMGKANFRFILYGLESANQETLDKLDKGVKVQEQADGFRMAKKAGLEPHATVMLGYPWETEEMAKNTIKFAKDLFDQGYIDTMQATITIPYPGTPLYKECVEKDWLQVAPDDYEAFDMRGPVMKIPFSNERLMELTQELYSSFVTPKYIIRKILSIRKIDDVKFYAMSAKKLLAHLIDFDKDQSKGKANWWDPRFWGNVVRSFFN